MVKKILNKNSRATTVALLFTSLKKRAA